MLVVRCWLLCVVCGATVVVSGCGVLPVVVVCLCLLVCVGVCWRLLPLVVVGCRLLVCVRVCPCLFQGGQCAFVGGGCVVCFVCCGSK